MGYSVNKLECKYAGTSNTVLRVENLTINKGEIVFFLGASGVGKSTILETLGLMNNTICASSDTVFNFHEENSTFNLINIWDKKESHIARFRRDHLSFIFQSTNLFPTLNVEDNALITSVLQGETEINSKNKVRKIFRNIFSKEFKELLDNKPINQMSGGQRQRLAFVRAIASNYSILLADEPTGNLDWANANNLMSFLVEDIKSKSATSVIVSHDINLAVLHADKIVYMDKRLHEKDNYYYGYINDANTYVRQSSKGWSNQVSYSGMEPPVIDDDNLIAYFKEKIIQQNIGND